MYKVSSSTIVRANERTRTRRILVNSTPAKRRDAIVVGLSYNGRQYTQELTINQMREAYGRALKIVKATYGGTEYYAKGKNCSKCLWKLQTALVRCFQRLLKF